MQPYPSTATDCHANSRCTINIYRTSHNWGKSQKTRNINKHLDKAIPCSFAPLDQSWYTLHMDASYAVTICAHADDTSSQLESTTRKYDYLREKHRSNPWKPSCRTEIKHAWGIMGSISKPASCLGFNHQSWGSTRSLKALPARNNLTGEYCQTFVSLIEQQGRQHQAHTVTAITMT